MKVILLRDVRSVGQYGDIKNVADGYAMNYLLPQKLAEVATPDKLAKIEQMKAAQTAAKEKEVEELVHKAQSLNGKTVKISARATEKGGLFKAIGAGEISRALASEHQIGISEDAIEVPTPIKTTGEHVVYATSKAGKTPFGVIVQAA